MRLKFPGSGLFHPWHNWSFTCKISPGKLGTDSTSTRLHPWEQLQIYQLRKMETLQYFLFSFGKSYFESCYLPPRAGDRAWGVMACTRGCGCTHHPHNHIVLVCGLGILEGEKTSYQLHVCLKAFSYFCWQQKMLSNNTRTISQAQPIAQTVLDCTTRCNVSCADLCRRCTCNKKGVASFLQLRLCPGFISEPVFLVKVG